MGSQLNTDTGDELQEAYDINVTPFIDVMLVLLIIFMVAAPLATVDVPVDLPASSAEKAQRPDQPLFLTVRHDLSLSLGEELVSRSQLKSALNTFTEGDKETLVFLRADKTVDYGDLMQIMNALREAGYLKIALVGIKEQASGQIP